MLTNTPQDAVCTYKAAGGGVASYQRRYVTAQPNDPAAAGSGAFVRSEQLLTPALSYWSFVQCVRLLLVGRPTSPGCTVFDTWVIAQKTNHRMVLKTFSM